MDKLAAKARKDENTKSRQDKFHAYKFRVFVVKTFFLKMQRTNN